MEQEKIYQIALSLLPGVGPVTAKNLIAYAGSIEEIFRLTDKALNKIPGIGKQLAINIKSNEALKRAEKEIRFIEKHNIKVSYFLDKDYPPRLKQCEDAPLIIFQKGPANHNNDKAISIVGTRKATDYGLGICKTIIKELSEDGHRPLIVSGLAYGIDICAHLTAMENDLETVAVLGHGLDIIYPAAHKKYAREIARTGGLVSDFPSQSGFDKKHFIKRNRIIAGLSDATIVIESREKGGALITADIAHSYNRDVFAVPGRRVDKSSSGCNQLIKRNIAGLVESAADIEYFMGWEKNRKKQANRQIELFPELTEQEERIVKTIQKNEPIEIDILCHMLKMSPGKISPVLLDLEFAGVVKALPGKSYKINTNIFL